MVLFMSMPFKTFFNILSPGSVRKPNTCNDRNDFNDDNDLK